ncbi:MULTISPECIES: hypothetical protein [unclassified Tateyamaria]|jgi:hypothetical protein|uniref:hypothetical protein n=1 Tax=unclassified Tateyamaria TaxID=2645127 RepID=UPI000D550EBA|nr:hypothetical protein [Tateyamaria sp. Alg231-49]
MTKYAALTALAALTFPALAMGQSAADLDVNGDGVLTIDEVQASMPEVTTDMFTTMDLNADGALDAEEIAAAQEAGLMPATDG